MNVLITICLKYLIFLFSRPYFHIYNFLKYVQNYFYKHCVLTMNSKSLCMSEHNSGIVI